jgi:hypothetical protein
MNTIEGIPYLTKLRIRIARNPWIWYSNHQRMNATKKMEMNKRTGLLRITKRKSSQIVHLHDLTTNIFSILSYAPWESGNNAKYLWGTWKTSISEEYMRILPRNHDRQKQTYVCKKTVLDMKILIFSSDWPGHSNRRDNIRSSPHW